MVGAGCGVIGPRIGSVCSGYEGLGAAVQAVLGGELAFVADIDPDASKLLAHRFPGVPNLGDIKAVDWVSLGAVDIFCGGFPCQPFSAAGRRLGTDDPRHLWPYLAKAIGVLRPPLVVLENVYGHLTLGFDIVLADLAALGYDAEWVVVTAAAAGACHRRARLFVLAFPSSARAALGVPVAVIKDGELIEPCESLFGAVPFAGRIPASGSMAGGRVHESPAVPVTGMTAGLLPTPQEFDSHFGEIGISPEAAARQMQRTDGYQRSTTGSLTKDLLMLKTPTAQLAVNGGSQHPDKRRAGGHGPTLADQVEHELPPTPTRADGERGSGTYCRGNPTLAGALLPTPNVADASRGHKTRSGDRKGEPLLGGIEMLLPTPTAQDAANARNATANRSPGSAHHAGTTLCDVFHDNPPAGTDWGPYEPAIRRWEAVTGRLAPEPTVPGRKGNRVLNAALPEWMMGLPAGWITDVPGLSRNAQLKLAGNGVVVQQGVLALRLLLARAEFTVNEADEAA